jgi:thiamine transport system ATP-binding protein
LISLKKVGFERSNKQNFHFDLELKKRDALAIIGPSGAGKSTLLNLIAGFLPPSEGEIFIENENVTKLPPSARQVTMLFQEHNLFPHLTIFENIGVGINPGLKLRPSDKEQISAALSRVSLVGYDNRYPYQLSGGQKQRVAIARALVQDKAVLLLDEPFSYLDPPLKLEMLDLVKCLQQERSFTMIMVTHDYQDSLRVCNKTAFLSEGVIKFMATNKQFAKQANIQGVEAYLGDVEPI